MKIFLWVNKMKIDKGRVMWFLFLIISFVVITFRLIQIKKVKNINQKQVSIFEKKFNDFLIEKFNSNVETIVITDYTKKSEREEYHIGCKGNEYVVYPFLPTHRRTDSLVYLQLYGSFALGLQA